MCGNIGANLVNSWLTSRGKLHVELNATVKATDLQDKVLQFNHDQLAVHVCIMY